MTTRNLHIKRIMTWILVAISLVSSLAWREITARSVSEQPFAIVAGQYLHQTANEKAAMELADQYGLVLDQVKTHYSIFLAEPTRDADSLISAGFSYNAISTVSAPPWKITEDPYLDQQYGLELTRTIEAWDLQGTNVTRVAIIDSGIDIDHVEFQGKISPLSFNAVTGLVGLERIRDDIGHGTMVAGIIGAIKSNGKGIAGISASVELLVIKANIPGEKSFSDSAIVDGIYYAIEKGARIINLSLGGNYANPLTEAAIATARENGVLVIAASGNDGSNIPIYPASFSDSVSVSAIGPTQRIAPFSSFGPEVDLTAPGESIITTAMSNGYATVDGTSFSAPHVTGILALFFSKYPEIHADEALSRLNQTAIDLGNPGRDDQYGHGLVDATQFLSESFVQVDFETFTQTDMLPIWIPANSLVPIPNSPTMPDKIFIGWYQDMELQTPWDFSTSVAVQDLTLYAKYTSEFHTVSFVTEGTAVESVYIRHDESLTLPVTTLLDASFDGWYLDPEFESIFEGGPIETDLTLYAKFTPIVYYDVTLMGLNDSITTITLREGSQFYPEDLVIEGYDFLGWYWDKEATLLYEATEISGHMTLFAYLKPMMMTVSLVVPEQEIVLLEVAYGQVPDFPEISSEGMMFAGWFTDETYLSAYQNEPIFSETILYAKMASKVFQVTLELDSSTILQVFVLEGESLDIKEPIRTGHIFTGWYFDEEKTISYGGEEIVSDTKLYAGFSVQILTVSFYSPDLTTVIHTETVTYGDNVNPPEAPIKASTPSLAFEFVGWSEDFNNVCEDLQVFPLYRVIFDADSVRLKSGVDTIIVGTDWIDAGVLCLDSSINVMTVSLVNTMISDKYQVTYQYYYGDELVHEQIRIVRVIEETPRVIITLNPGITTIFVGETYQDHGATSSEGTVETIGIVDTNHPGVYRLVYRVSVYGYEFTKSRYVTVLDRATLLSYGLSWIGGKDLYEAF